MVANVRISFYDMLTIWTVLALREYISERTTYQNWANNAELRPMDKAGNSFLSDAAL